MRIKNLKLKNYRNYSEECVEFGENLNVLFGKNAQGKTNCAEAVFYLCTGVSPRCKRDKQLIKHGEEYAELSATAQGRYGNMEIYAKIYESGREFRLNGSKITRSADILGNLFSVFFSPQELLFSRRAAAHSGRTGRTPQIFKRFHFPAFKALFRSVKPLQQGTRTAQQLTEKPRFNGSVRHSAHMGRTAMQIRRNSRV